MDIIEAIYRKHAAAPDPAGILFPPHHPEILYFGCFDARLPMAEVGIPMGKVMIPRDPAAFVYPDSAHHLDQGSALEAAIKGRGVKHVVVTGHTDCNAIGALTEKRTDWPRTMAYLAPLEPKRVQFEAQGIDKETQKRRLEQEAVRMSLRNLRSYDLVREREQKGELELHGWILDVRTNALLVLDEKRDVFVSCADVLRPDARKRQGGE